MAAASWTSTPPSPSSRALMRQRMGMLPPVFLRMFSIMSLGRRMRFSKQPPNSSVRLFVRAEMKVLTR